MQFVPRHAPFFSPGAKRRSRRHLVMDHGVNYAFRMGIRLRRLRNRIAEQAPSPGGNLPSDRYLTHDFYSLRRWTKNILPEFPEKSSISIKF